MHFRSSHCSAVGLVASLEPWDTGLILSLAQWVKDQALQHTEALLWPGPGTPYVCRRGRVAKKKKKRRKNKNKIKCIVISSSLIPSKVSSWKLRKRKINQLYKMWCKLHKLGFLPHFLNIPHPFGLHAFEVAPFYSWHKFPPWPVLEVSEGFF